MNAFHRFTLAGMLLFILIAVLTPNLTETQLDTVIRWFSIFGVVFILVPRHLKEDK